MFCTLISISFRCSSFGNRSSIDNNGTGANRHLRNISIGRDFIREQLSRKLGAILRQWGRIGICDNGSSTENSRKKDDYRLRFEGKTNVHSHFPLPSFPLKSVGGEATEEPMRRPSSQNARSTATAAMAMIQNGTFKTGILMEKISHAQPSRDLTASRSRSIEAPTFTKT